MVNKLYVLVRGDLTKSQQAVQACHAVAEFMLYSNEVNCWCGQCGSDQHWKNETIVLLKVKDLDHLNEWTAKVKEATKWYQEFSEPDIGNQMTAIAAYGDSLEVLLRDLPLL